MDALGKAAGVEVAYVTGYIRDAHRGADAGAATTDEGVKQALEGFRHAWNAVKIDGAWQLVDATWDDPTTPTGEQTLVSTYLFTPPRLFALDHLPEEAAWQLVDPPLGAGDFARQPLLNPRLGALGMSLEQPTRSQITVDGEATIVLANPRKAEVAANVETGKRCDVTTAGGKTRVTCAVPPGQHEIELFGARDDTTGVLDYVGSILVNGR
jgi:transglutaminase/protease-like cytokinesis protein 3